MIRAIVGWALIGLALPFLLAGGLVTLLSVKLLMLGVRLVDFARIVGNRVPSG